MTTVRVKTRLSSIDKNKMTVYYQVSRRNISRQIRSGYSIRTSEWDAEHGTIRLTGVTDMKRTDYLKQADMMLKNGLSRLQTIVRQLERTSSDTYTTDDVVSNFRSADGGRGFVAFGRQRVDQLKRMEKRQKAERYNYTLNSFCRFRKDQDVPICSLDSNMMIAYENYLKDEGLCMNTSSYYMRNLRAIYNSAIEKGLAVNADPFRHVYTGIGKTVKRAISLQTLRQVKRLDLTRRPGMEFVRDLFMFSVYTRGMSFVDMAYLRKKDLQGDILTYHRHKTGQLLKVKWENAMQRIVERHGNTDSLYMLPILDDTLPDRHKQYKNALRLTNKRLKEIGKMIGLDKPLTTYVARHAWASIAREQDVPITIISEAMGHNSEMTTRIYLASLDTSKIDKANRVIMDALE